MIQINEYFIYHNRQSSHRYQYIRLVLPRRPVSHYGSGTPVDHRKHHQRDGRTDINFEHRNNNVDMV